MAQVKAVIFDYFGVLSIDDTRMVSLVKELKANYKTGLFTNLGEGRVNDIFSLEEQAQLFDLALSSGDIGLYKPDPRAFEDVAYRLGCLPEECVFIDDREGYASGAVQTGMKFITFKNYDQCKKELELLLNA